MTAPYADRLDVARAMVTARDELRDQTPGWLLDQVDAAGREQHRLLLEVSAHLPIVDPSVRGWYQSSAASMEEFGLDRLARLYAASIGCQPCIHLRRHGPQPAWADLNHRIVTCQRCAATWRTPIDDERCEVCDEPAGPRFTPFLIQLGYLAVGGNAGDCCARLVTGEVAA